MEKFIVRLITEINETINVIILKLNSLSSSKEDKANKKTDLTSTSNLHYPSVPAVKTAVDNVLVEANTYTDTKVTEMGSKYILKTEKGSVNGVAELDGNGKIPSSQLPSYVDDIVDIEDFVTTLPTSGMTVGQKYYRTTDDTLWVANAGSTLVQEPLESDKIYVKVSDSTTWRWSGSTLVQMNAGLVLGETETTAYRGDRGKEAYDHSVNMGDALTPILDWSAQLESQTNF